MGRSVHRDTLTALVRFCAEILYWLEGINCVFTILNMDIIMTCGNYNIIFIMKPNVILEEYRLYANNR